MNQAAAWIVVAIIIIAIVGGFAYFRTTAPTTQEQAESTEDVDFVDETTSVPGQFIQQVPNVLAPSPESSPTPTAWSGDEQTGSATPSAGTVTIEMTDTGFTPATATVAPSTTVTFVNNGQGLHWPASAVHPTHEVLPGFDSTRGLATGEEYSFTFTQTGTWPYHDHLNPSFTGSIIVQ